MYFGSASWPWVGFGTVTVVGSKISTTWNGLIWMWNGWDIPAVAFVIFHSSTVLRSTVWAFWEPSNFWPLIVWLDGKPPGTEAKSICFVPVASASVISSRKAGGFGATGMNCD